MSFNTISNLLRRKPLAQFENEGVASSHLNRCLSPLDLVFLGVGAIIGTGIFVLTGVTAATTSGPAVVLSYLIAGVVCAFVALCYSELSANIGGCGGAYGYTYATFGELAGFLVAWVLILEYMIATTAVSVGWSGYFMDVLRGFGVSLPDALTTGYFVDSEKGFINLPAAGVILTIMCLLVVGVRQSASLNAVLVAIKIFAVVVFIGIAIFNVDVSLWDPFMPFGWYEVLPNGKTTGVLAGAALVFFAYIGFDAVATAAEETKNPTRDVPIGIIGSLLFCSIIYIIVSGLMTGIISYKELNVSSPASHALAAIGSRAGSAIVGTAVIAGLVSVMLVLYYALTRVFFALSRDQLIPDFFSSVNRKTKTPVRVIIGAGLVMAFIAGVLPFKQLVEIINIGTLFAFIFVCIGVPASRLRFPDRKQVLTLPGKGLIPIVGALSCLGLILALPSGTIKIFVLWMIAGLLFYIFYSYSSSKLSDQ